MSLCKTIVFFFPEQMAHSPQLITALLEEPIKKVCVDYNN